MLRYTDLADVSRKARLSLFLLIAFAASFALLAACSTAATERSEVKAEDEISTPSPEPATEVPPSIPSSPPVLIERSEALRNAAAATAERFSQSDSVVIASHERVRYEASGTAESWDETYIKVLTEKGKREHQILSYSFILPYNEVSFALVEVIKPDGSSLPVDIQTMGKVMIDPEQMDENIFDPNQKLFVVGVPGLEIGDMVHSLVLNRTIKPLVPDSWSDYQVFEWDLPIVKAVFEVHAPRERPLKSIALKSPVPGTVQSEKTEREGRIHYRWEISDVPRIFAEPNMPEQHTVVQRLLVSTISDWKELSLWYWGVSEPHLKSTTPAMAEKVAEITKGLSDRRQIIEAVFRWVSQEVRYLGITVESLAPGFEPHDVHMTFEKRHGVCRDKAALLVSMLRLAGLEAFPVIIYVGPKKDIEVPQPYFNHAITAVDDGQGSYILMDPTNENTKELFPAYLNNRSYLVARPKGETLLTSPVSPAEDNMLVLETSGKLAADGSFKAETTAHFSGFFDNMYRNHFARLKPEERRQYIERIAREVNAGAVLKEAVFTPQDMLDTSKPLAIDASFYAENVLAGDNSAQMFFLDILDGRLELFRSSYLSPMVSLEKRRFPLDFSIPSGVKSRMAISLDPELSGRVTLPEPERIENEYLSWSREFSLQGGVLKAEAKLLVKAVEFSPEQYVKLKEDLEVIERTEREAPVFGAASPPNAGKTADSSDANLDILERRASYDLVDERNWNETAYVKFKILTYSGKKDNSEIKISFNPIWEDVRIENVRVINGKAVHKISDKEINVMDAPWVASAPRYPPEKVLVASLPGLEVGSVVEYTLKRMKRDQPFFSTTQVLRGFDPQQSTSVEISAPDSVLLKMLFDQDGLFVHERKNKGAEQTLISSKSEKASGKSSYRWQAKNQPAIRRENNMAPLGTFAPLVRASAGDWKTYAERVESALLEAARGQTSADALSRGLFGSSASPREGITKIRDFVAMNIRDVGPGISDLPLEHITSADRTLAEGYGNSADRAVLLFAMLEAAGLRPEFVLAGSGTPVKALQEFERSYPSAEQFPSVLVHIALDGKDIYLNDTDQYAPLGATALDGFDGLFLSSGEIRPIVASEPTQVDFSYGILLDAAGSALYQKTVSNYGLAFADTKRRFFEMRPEERKRYFQEIVAAVSQAASPLGTLRTEFKTPPGIESFSAKIDRWASRSKNLLYFTPPGHLKNILQIASAKRSTPYYESRRSRVNVTTIVEVSEPNAEVVYMPKTAELSLPGGGGKVIVMRSTLPADSKKSKGLRFALENSVAVEPYIAMPDEYGQLLEMFEAVNHPEAKTVIVRTR